MNQQPEQNKTDFAKEAEALINEYGWLTAKDFEPVLRGIMHGYSLQSQQTASLQKQYDELKGHFERTVKAMHSEHDRAEALDERVESLQKQVDKWKNLYEAERDIDLQAIVTEQQQEIESLQKQVEELREENGKIKSRLTFAVAEIKVLRGLPLSADECISDGEWYAFIYDIGSRQHFLKGESEPEQWESMRAHIESKYQIYFKSLNPQDNQKEK